MKFRITSFDMIWAIALGIVFSNAFCSIDTKTEANFPKFEIRGGKKILIFMGKGEGK